MEPNQIPPAPVKEVIATPSKTHHFLLGFLILIIVGSVVFSVTLLLKPQVLEETTVVTDQYADWKTYRNEELGFEIKYPANYIVKDNEISLIHDVVAPAFTAGYTVMIFDAAWYKDETVPPQTPDKIINGINVFIIPATPDYTDIDYGAEFETKGDYNIIVSFRTDADKYNDKVAELDQILSTFKFIEPTATSTVDTTNWETYKNSQYGFEFKYPPYFFRPVLTEDNEIVFQTNSQADSEDDGLYLKVFKRSNGFHLSEYFYKCPSDEKGNPSYKLGCPYETGKDNSKEWYIYDLEDGIYWETDMLLDSHGEVLVDIAVTGSQNSKNTGATVDKIISTFKFTK